MKRLLGIVCIYLVMNFGYSGVGVESPSEFIDNNTVSSNEIVD